MQYTITVEYLPHKYYKNEFIVLPKDIIAKTETMFFKEIFREIKKAAKASGSTLYFKEDKIPTKTEDSTLDEQDVVEDESKACKRLDIGELHESSDEEEVAEDADATATRSVSRHQENREYDDPEEGEEEPEDVEEMDVDKNTLKNRDEDIDDMVSAGQTINGSEYEQRKQDVVNMYVHAIDYDYDIEKNRWCKLKFWVRIFFQNILCLYIKIKDTNLSSSYQSK